MIFLLKSLIGAVLVEIWVIFFRHVIFSRISRLLVMAYPRRLGRKPRPFLSRDVGPRKGVELILPVDFVCSSKFGEDGEIQDGDMETGGRSALIWFSRVFFAVF